MEITDVRVRKVLRNGRMKAIVSVTFDNEFVIHDIKVVESGQGLFIAMPSHKTQEGGFRDIAHPINPATRASLQERILAKYNQVLASGEFFEEAAAGKEL